MTGVDTPTGKAVCRDLLAEGYSVREYNAVITEDGAQRLVRHVDLVVHADWLWVAPSFEAEVEHNLQATIKLAAAAEAAGVTLKYALDFDPNRSIKMAVQVLRDEYHVEPFWPDGAY